MARKILITTLILGTGFVSCQNNSVLQLDNLKGIYLPGPLSEVEKETVSFLQEGFKTFYQIPLEVVSENNLEPVIVLGRRAALQKKLISQKELDSLRPDGYVIQTSNQYLLIAGPDSWATYYGVVGFFQRQGVKFYQAVAGKFKPWPWFNADFPEKPERSINLSLKEKPAFAYRCGGKPVFRQTKLADPRNGANPEIFDAKKTGSNLWIDHTAGYLVPKLLYYDQHPDYYAMGKDGKRIAKDSFSDHTTPLCLSHPDVIRISIERALAWIEKNPEERYFMITYGDTNFWCQCQECLKLDPVPGEYSTRLLTWVNAVAREVAKKYPDKILITFAYAGSDAAPPSIKPEPNVWVCGSTGLGNIPFWDHAFASEMPDWLVKNVSKVDGWLKVCPDQYLVCEYLSGVYLPALIDTTASRLKTYARRKLRGVLFTYGEPVNFRCLWQYLWGQLMWDPDQDVEKLTRDFLRFTYPAAWEPLVKYFQLSRQRYQETLKEKAGLDNMYPKGYYRKDFVQQLLACFQQAEEKLKSQAEMAKEIEKEEGYLIANILEHPPETQLTEEVKQVVTLCVHRLSQLGKSTGKTADFLSSLNRTVQEVERRIPGYRNLVEEILGQLPESQPVQIPGGLRLPPEIFRRADLGPTSGADWVHPDYKFPPRTYVGVLQSAKDSRGRPTSSVMVAKFKISQVPAGPVTLELEGQDAITKWAAGNQRAMSFQAKMKITLNGKEIYSGPADFVRGNWSRRSFEIKPGILQVGENSLEIANISQGFAFSTCYLLISDALLKWQ